MTIEGDPKRGIPKFLQDQGYARVILPESSPYNKQESAKEESQNNQAFGRFLDALYRALSEPSEPLDTLEEEIPTPDNPIDKVFKRLSRICSAEALLSLSTIYSQHVLINVEMTGPEREFPENDNSYIFVEGFNPITGALFTGPRHNSVVVNTPNLEDGPEVALPKAEEFAARLTSSVSQIDYISDLMHTKSCHMLVQLESGETIHSFT